MTITTFILMIGLFFLYNNKNEKKMKKMNIKTKIIIRIIFSINIVYYY